MNKATHDDRMMLKVVYEALDDKFGLDIKILDIRHISIMADYFIITNGNNKNHIKTLADEVEMKLSQIGYTQRHSEGYQDAHWILLDFESLIIHIFDKENREFYNLERIWGDAHSIDPTEL